MKKCLVWVMVLLLCAFGAAEENVLVAKVGEEYVPLAQVGVPEGFVLASVEADPVDGMVPVFAFLPQGDAPLQAYSVQRGLDDADALAGEYAQKIGSYVRVLGISDVTECTVNGAEAYAFIVMYVMNTSNGASYVQNALVYLDVPVDGVSVVLSGVNIGPDESAFRDSGEMVNALLLAAESVVLN